MQPASGPDQLVTGAAARECSQSGHASKSRPSFSADVEIGQAPRLRSLVSQGRQVRPSAARPLLGSAMHQSFFPLRSITPPEPSSVFPLVSPPIVSPHSALDPLKDHFFPSCSPPPSPLVKMTRPTLRQSHFSTFFTSGSTGSHPELFPNDEQLDMVEESTSPPNGWQMAQNLRDGAIHEWESQRNTQPILLAATGRPTLSRSHSDCGFLPPSEPHQTKLFPLPTLSSPGIQSWVAQSSIETLASTPFLGRALSLLTDGSNEPSHFSGPCRPTQFKRRPTCSPLHQHVVSRSFPRLPFRWQTPQSPLGRSRSASVPSSLDPASSSLSGHTKLASALSMKGECRRTSLKAPPSSCFGDSQASHKLELKLQTNSGETEQPESHGFQHIRGKTAPGLVLPHWIEYERNFRPRNFSRLSSRGCVELGDGSRKSYFPTLVS